MGRRERGGFCMKHSAQTLFFLFVILGDGGGAWKGTRSARSEGVHTIHTALEALAGTVREEVIQVGKEEVEFSVLCAQRTLGIPLKLELTNSPRL